MNWRKEFTELYFLFTFCIIIGELIESYINLVTWQRIAFIVICGLPVFLLFKKYILKPLMEGR